MHYSPGWWELLRRHNHDLVIEGRRIVATALGIDDLPGNEMIGSMAAFALVAGQPVRVNDFDPLSVALRETHRIEVPISPFQASGIRHQASAGEGAGPDLTVRLLRISARVYNRTEEYGRLCIGPRCRRRHRHRPDHPLRAISDENTGESSNPPRTIPTAVARREYDPGDHCDQEAPGSPQSR